MSRGRAGDADFGAGDPLLPFGPDTDDHSDVPPRRRKRRVAAIAGVVAVALLLAATSLFWLVVSPSGRAASAGARLGDCLIFDAGGPTYRAADCSDAAAQFRLLAVTVDRESCVDVPGVTRAYTEGGRVYCIGEKSADPATALNGIAAGDCVAVEAGRPLRAACEGSTLPVLAVVKDVPKALGETGDGLVRVCVQGGAGEVRQTYAWGLGAADGAESKTWDRLLCLGAS